MTEAVDFSTDEFISKSIQQCISVRNREQQPPSRGGVKDYAPDGSWLESKRLDSFLEERNDVLSEERVKLSSTLSYGEWLCDLGKVLVEKKSGKWGHYLGHSENGKDYLYPEEATYLVEQGQLVICSFGIPLSVEEVYRTILAGRVPMHHYVVYAHLSRYGYALNRFTGSTECSSEYEKNIGLDKIKAKCKRSKKKLNIKEASCEDTNHPFKKRKLENENIEKHRDVAIVDDINSDNSNIDIDPWNEYMSSDLSRILHSSSGIPYSKWDFDTLSFPDISSNTCKRLKILSLPVPPKDLLPPGIHVVLKSVEFDLRSYFKKGTYQPPDLEYSFGSAGWKALSKANNWKEYNQECMLQTEANALLQSPVGHLWSTDVKPLVHPAQAKSTGSILAQLNIIRPFLSLKEQSSSPNKILPKDCPLNIVYNMYKIGKKFQKSTISSTVPLARICILKESDAVPDLATLYHLTSQCSDGAPLKFAMVDGGSVAFYSFDMTNLPEQTCPLE